MEKLFLPLAYAIVCDGIYRSSYPTDRTHLFIETLHLKSMIYLNENISPIPSRHNSLLLYAKERNIQFLEFDIKVNQEPFLTMSEETIDNILDFIQDSIHQPILIFCNNGKLRTSCLIACLRIRLGWSISSTIREMEQFADHEVGLADFHFIENYKFHYMKKLNVTINTEIKLTN
eukprot:gene5974-8229_t